MSEAGDRLPGLVVVALVSLAVGYGVRFFTEPVEAPPVAVEPVVEPAVVEPPAPEVPAPAPVDAPNRLERVQAQVRTLRARLRDRDGALASLERQGGATAAELEAARQAQAQVEIELSESRALRDAELEALRASVKQVEAERAEALAQSRTRQAEAGKALWRAFVDNAELRICGAGKTARVEPCKAAVRADLRELQPTFLECASGGGSLPVLARRSKSVPANAMFLSTETSAATAGWYLVPCAEKR